jgi:hypothetical protein
MDPERWNRISSAFLAVRERPPGERSSYLVQVCGDDPELLEEVAGMLAADSAGGELEVERGALGQRRLDRSDDVK